MTTHMPIGEAARQICVKVPTIRHYERIGAFARPTAQRGQPSPIRRRRLSAPQRIASLTALETELERMVASCSHGRVDQCRVIEALELTL